MKTIFCLFLLLTSFVAFSRETKDSVTVDTTQTSITFSGFVLVTNNGFSPIPAFSFDRPTLMTFLTISKNHFRYEPDISFGFDAHPWMINNWLKYRLVNSEKLSISSGINPGLFFLNDKDISGEKPITAHRNLTVELMGDYSFSKRFLLSLMTRYNEALDKGTVSGYFFNLTAGVSNIMITKNASVQFRSQAFYFDNAGKIDGLYTSAMLNTSHKKVPFTLFIQGVQPLWVNFEGAGFKWNYGGMFFFR